MPSPFEKHHVLLGVTGSAAANRAVELAAKLHQSGGLVETILSQDALYFVTPLSFQTVTQGKVYTNQDLWGAEGSLLHLNLGKSTHLAILAPANASSLARLAQGDDNDLLTRALMAINCPLVVAPAFDPTITNHPSVQRNIETLKQRGVTFFAPRHAHLATASQAMDWMVAPDQLLAEIRFMLGRKGPFSGKKIVVTAGATQEPMDPVRFITNRSTGRQGYVIAQAALDAGADVVLISGPTALTAPVGARMIQVRTAEQMCNAVLAETDETDVLVMAAAVSDFQPVHLSDMKIKRQAGSPEVELIPTVDILAVVAEQRLKTDFPKWVIGFAAETENLLENAMAKLEARNMDMIVVHDILAPDIGFEGDTNRVTLLFDDGRIEELPLLTKEQVAENLIHKIKTWLIE